MKKYLTLCLVVALITFQSCSDDDGPTSTITMDGSSFKISSVMILGVAIDGEGHASVNFVSGSGNDAKTLQLDIEYTPPTTLTGTYSFPQQGTDRYLDDWLSVYTQFDGMNSTSTHLESGTLTLTDHGNSSYTIVIDVTMEDGTVFKGTYKGKVQATFQNG